MRREYTFKHYLELEQYRHELSDQLKSSVTFHFTSTENKQTKKKTVLKGALSRYSVFLCRFFAVENGGEETRGRGAGQ